MILWPNRVATHSKAKVETRSLISSRVEVIVEERDSSSLMDSISLFILPSVPPNPLSNLALPHISPALPCTQPRFVLLPLELPAFDHPPS